MDKRKKSGRKKRKSGRRFHPVEIIILAVAIVVLCVSAFQLIGIFMEYKAGSDAYDALRDKYVTVVPEELTSTQEEKAGETQEAEREDADADYFPEYAIDFDALGGVNGDITGWIYIPVLNIDYPVVQGTDNEYYLTHTFEKKENTSGAIFMDSGANPQLTDYNTLVYGHNMKNGSMFGKLKNFQRDDSLCAETPYIFYYTKEKSYKYLIVSYYVTVDGSDSYYLPQTEESYEEYRSLILKKAIHSCTREIPENMPMLTLSTCHGNAGGEERFLVHGILEEVRDVR
ncbi:MAG: class B sortase [Eubacteriales bacterium]|nr:class B sortase [Eubacteriales bacterium]